MSSGAGHSGDHSTECAICLGSVKFPRGRPDACGHIFCFLCISNWVERRSECPLCKGAITSIAKITADGKKKLVKVRERTAAHYENEFVTQEELGVETPREEDITVAYARCRVCHESTNEHQLMLCDGVVGHEADGTEVRCNAAYHCYCLAKPLREVPEGDWYCPFCVDMLATQRGVYNRRYSSAARRGRVVESSSDDEAYGETFRQPRGSFLDDDRPGPSRRAPALNWESDTEESSLFDEETEILENESLLNSDDNEPSNVSADESVEDSSSCEANAVEGDTSDWEAIDDFVLEEPPEEKDYIAAGRTPVKKTRRRKKIKKCSRKRQLSGRKKVCKPAVKGKRKKRRRQQGQRISVGQRRLATAIGINPVSGARLKKPRKKGHREFPSDGIRRGKFGAPLLSLDRGDNDDIPVDETEEATSRDAVPQAAESKPDVPGDLVDSIIFEQTKLLAPSNCRALSRDGRILDTKNMAEYRTRVEEIFVSVEERSSPKAMSAAAPVPCEKPQVRLTGRKNRPSRWGSPAAASAPPTLATASIPLPSGPPRPIHSHTLLDSIPVPQRTTVAPQISPHIALTGRPSALNTSPSTSFAVNAFASPLPPPFAIGSAPSTSLQQIGNAHIPPQHLLQIPSPLFSNLVMQPPISLGTVNNMLAAGFLGNTPFAPAISQGGPFVLNQVQFPSQSQHLSQQLASLASLQSAVSVATVHSRIPVAGVPPPPPAAARWSDVGVSVCEPISEKVRQLTEANPPQEMQPCEKNDGATNKISEEPKLADSGRKSASAEDEEASDVDTKTHKNGRMFEVARQMLSESLKKVFKKKQITKDEYKEIMKKGVHYLSQRSKLDQSKVDEYANKYVVCIIHRRKKKR